MYLLSTFRSYPNKILSDRSVVSFIKQIFEDQFFVDFCKSWEGKNVFVFSELAAEFQIHIIYKTCESIKNQLPNFGLIEKIIDPSHILLKVS